MSVLMANPLSPQSDQNQFSLVNFNSFKPREKVLRTNKIITKEKMFSLKFSLLVLCGNVWTSVYRISMWIQGPKGLISYQPIPLFGLFFSSCTHLISEFPLLHKPCLHFPPLLLYMYLQEYLPYLPSFHLLSNDLKYLMFFYQTSPTLLHSLFHLHSVFKYAFQSPNLLPSSQPQGSHSLEKSLKFRGSP